MNSQTPIDNIATRAKVKLMRDMGATLLDAFSDPQTVEIIVNPDGQIWQERLGEPMKCIGYLNPVATDAIIKTVAGTLGKEVTKNSPLLEGEFPLDGSRFAGQLPPVVSAPSFAIRKKAISIFTLDQYVDAEIMTDRQRAVLKQAVADHRNILVIGGTGSGKTTLVNAIINEMVIYAPHERIVIIEDTGEIQCAAQNAVLYHTTIDVSMTDLLKTSLRMRPDRILVGEVRGEEALDLIDAWNTGHEGGAATLHSNNAASGLNRLKQLITRNKAAPSEIEPLIGEVVHEIVHIARTPEGRRIKEILEVSGYVNGQYITKSL